MNNAFVCDIGDYGKYGLLRELRKTGLTLSVNWYRTDFETTGGGFIEYLDDADEFEHYDPELFRALRKIVKEDDRRIERIEEEKIVDADFFHDAIGRDRNSWWESAQRKTSDTDVVFLDPDNGLETINMRAKQTDSPKHVLWTELHEYYYKLGKTVILYQHRPQGESEVACKDRVLKMNSTLLDADYVHILDFPRFTNRYYFIFTRKRHEESIEALCNLMDTKWKGICEYKGQRYERAGVNDEVDEEG